MNHSTVQDSYGELKQKLITIAVEASKVITTFALLEQMIELQGQFCFSEPELERYNHDLLITKCQVLANKIQEHLPDLREFGFSDQVGMKLEQAILDFQLICEQHRVLQEELLLSAVVTAES